MLKFCICATVCYSSASVVHAALLHLVGVYLGAEAGPCWQGVWLGLLGIGQTPPKAAKQCNQFTLHPSLSMPSTTAMLHSAV